MSLFSYVRNEINKFVNREFIHNPRGVDGIVETTSIRLVTGAAYIGFAAVLFIVVTAIIRFILGNLGFIAACVAGVIVSYFVGMLVARRVREINKDSPSA